jgi:hypothetical protein
VSSFVRNPVCCMLLAWVGSICIRLLQNWGRPYRASACTRWKFGQARQRSRTNYRAWWERSVLW